MLFPGREAAGEVVVDPIGLPAAFAGGAGLLYTLEPEGAAALLPRRVPDSHKGTYGRLLVVGGSPGLTGAPVLAGLAALRCGTGLVTLGLREGLALPEKPPELMTAPWPVLRWEDFQAVVMGPGLSRAADGKELLWRLLPAEQPKVLDADALNLLAGEESWWQRLRGPAVLTPHPGEMARLCGVSPERYGRTAWTWCGRKHASGCGPCSERRRHPRGPAGRRRLYQSHRQFRFSHRGTGDVLAGVIGVYWPRGFLRKKRLFSGFTSTAPPVTWPPLNLARRG